MMTKTVITFFKFFSFLLYKIFITIIICTRNLNSEIISRVPKSLSITSTKNHLKKISNVKKYMASSKLSRGSEGVRFTKRRKFLRWHFSFLQ